MNSGNFKYLVVGDRVEGVFCLTRRGNLLAECGGRAEFASVVVEASREESVRIAGVVGEWTLADAIWQILVRSGSIASVTHAAREPLYRLDQAGRQLPERHSLVRSLGPADFDEWEPLNTAYLLEEGLPVQGSPEQRLKEFSDSAALGCWWGLWEDQSLISIGALNALYEQVGQIGGVYTVPEERRRGRARDLVKSLISDCFGSRRLGRLILFTGERNTAAQALYESLGFSRCGEFALFFGSEGDSEAL